MIVKVLWILVLIHAAKTQFNFRAPGIFQRGNAANLSESAGVGLLGAIRERLPGAGAGGGLPLPLAVANEKLTAGLGKILGDYNCPNLNYYVPKIGHEHFAQFQSTFKKSYVDEAEEKFRQEIFHTFLDAISNHNDLFLKGIEKFSLSVNHFSDWTHDEYIEILGVDLSQASNSGTKTGRKTRAIDNCQSPDSKDWRQSGAVTPVKNQLKCASCWAFSAAGALEGQFFLKNGTLNSLSEQQFVDCSKQLGNKGCNKGFMDNAFKYAQDNGIDSDKEYPYEGKENICRSSENSKKIDGIGSVTKGNEEELKKAVCGIGPVAAALDATDKKFMLYHDGVYFNKDCNPNNPTHAVLVVGYGYDESTELDYWLIKNSFGETWGNGGYGKVARNEKNHCGIANLASYPIV